MECFWFRDSGHGFEKLTQVDITFLYFTLRCCLFCKMGFVIFFIFFSIKLSQSHDLENRFCQLTQLFFLGCFVLSLFSVSSFKIEFFLKLSFIIYFIFLHSIRLSCSYDSTRNIWQSYPSLQMFFLVIYWLIDFFFISSFYIWIVGNRLSLFFHFYFYEVGPVINLGCKFFMLARVDLRRFTFLILIFFFIFII